jgi:hypothetical protein
MFHPGSAVKLTVEVLLQIHGSKQWRGVCVMRDGLPAVLAAPNADLSARALLLLTPATRVYIVTTYSVPVPSHTVTYSNELPAHTSLS